MSSSLNQSQAEQLKMHILNAAKALNLSRLNIIVKSLYEEVDDTLLGTGYSTSLGQENAYTMMLDDKLIMFVDPTSFNSATASDMIYAAQDGLCGVLTINNLDIGPVELLTPISISTNEDPFGTENLSDIFANLYVIYYTTKLHINTFGSKMVKEHLSKIWKEYHVNVSSALVKSIQSNDKMSLELHVYNALSYILMARQSKKDIAPFGPWMLKYTNFILEVFDDVDQLKMSWQETRNMLDYLIFGLRIHADIPKSVESYKLMKRTKKPDDLFYLENGIIKTRIWSDEAEFPSVISAPNYFCIYKMNQIEAAHKLGSKIINFFRKI